MKNLLLSASTLAIIGALSSAQAQDAPAGADATGCDVNAFSPVLSDRTGEILYWNNPSCPAGSGPATQSIVPSPPPNGGGAENGCVIIPDDGLGDMIALEIEGVA